MTDLETVARHLVAWCGLEWEPGCLEFYRGQTGRAHGQQHPGPATALRDLRGKVAALRAIAGNALDRAAGGTED